MNNQNRSLIDYLFILVKHRKFIIINFIIVAALASGYALMMSKTFSARATIMSPQESGTLLSQLPFDLPVGNFSKIIGGGGGINTYLAILNSRQLATLTIEKFNLKKRYGSKSIDEALISFKNNVETSLNEDGTVSISVQTTTEFLHPDSSEDTTRQLAADIANYMVFALDSINKTLQSRQATFTRKFVEQRYKSNKRDIRAVEEKLKSFEEKYGVISLPDQLSAAIEAASQLESRIILTEIELKSLRSVLEEENPQIIQKKIQFRELKSKLNDLTTKQSNETDFSLFPPFESAPELSINYLRLKREMEVQNAIFKFLTQQYEQAKLQEIKDTPTLQIVDNATTPTLRTKPSRKLFVISISFLAFLLSALYIFSLEYIKGLKITDEARYHRVKYVIRGFNIFKKLPEK